MDCSVGNPGPVADISIFRSDQELNQMATEKLGDAEIFPKTLVRYKKSLPSLGPY